MNVAVPSILLSDIEKLAARLEGELHHDTASRRIYATDASEYQEMPLAVAFPKTEDDLRQLILFAGARGIGLIPRAAGTSLAGQVVGHGIVVDIGKHLNRVLDYEADQRRVRVQPGVIRDDLNRWLNARGVFFAPETSTANRAMIGGMVGNNSCGANSIVYGSTRDHLVSARGFLSDGSEATFGPLTAEQFEAKCAGPDCLETRLYRFVRDLLANKERRGQIRDGFPKAAVTRRNTGYALDQLMECQVFDPDSAKPFNLCRLIAGSEGTLFFGVEFELNCEPLPPPGALMCAHFESVNESLKAAVLAMRHGLFGCELIDRHILECTKENLTHAPNRFFVQGDPGAVLVIDIRHENPLEIETKMQLVEAELRSANLGYAYPIVRGQDCARVWDLRKAGQGLMNIVPGDAKPREIVEDTAVSLVDLPAYIEDFDALMKRKYGLSCVYYAHAGAGELHTRPLFNLKTEDGRRKFRSIATDVAALVKKYRGSLSGEHGDGRLRGEFIRYMVGDPCYAMMREVKKAFDPKGIFNPGKIIDTPPMDSHLRHELGHATPSYKTTFDFSATQGIVRAAEACTGVGECRKSHLAGGTMCPSYMATRNEKDTTRARANVLRQILTNPPNKRDPWNSEEIKDVMDLCLSCKACKSECPSNVDVARLKAEWQQRYYDANGVPFRSRLVAGFATSMRLASRFPGLYNWAVQSASVSGAIKRFAGFAPGRSLPEVSTITLSRWCARHANPATLHYPNGTVHLFCDEFTNYNDAPIGIAAVELLNRLGYKVVIPPHVESGRAHISKGLIRRAQELAIRNVELLKDIITADAPLIGIEPSAILGFRDEYPDLMPDGLKSAARALAKQSFLIDEFIANEAEAGRIASGSFTLEPQAIKLHGHCHQKALASMSPTIRMLHLPLNYKVESIPSACCGMAGSFGYESEHFEVSQKMGELVLFPAVRAAAGETLLAATGTSCRHQIKDGTGRLALHPIQILRLALNSIDSDSRRPSDSHLAGVD